MAISVTLRETQAAASGTSITSGSFTPSANSLLMVCAAIESDGSAISESISDSLTSSWTKQVVDGGTGDGSYPHKAVIWTTEIGGSPSSMTVTVGLGTSMYNSELVVLDATGYDTTTPVGLTASMFDDAQNTQDTETPAYGGTTASDSLSIVVGATDDYSGEGTQPDPTTGWTDHHKTDTTGLSIGVFSRIAALTAPSIEIGGTFGFTVVGMEVKADSGSGTDALTANSLTSAVAVDTSAITQVHALTANSLTSAVAVDTSALTQLHVLAGDSLTSAVAVDQTTLSESHALTANSLTSAVSVDTSDIAQVHAITADSLTSAVAVDTADITQLHALAGDSLTSAVAIDQPAVSETHILAGDSLTSAVAVDTSDIAQTHALSGDSLTSAVAVDTSDITQVHGLAGNSLTSAVTIDSPELGSGADHNLLGNSLTSAVAIDTGDLGQLHVLTGNSLTSAVSVDTPALNGGGATEQEYLGGNNYGAIRRQKSRASFRRYRGLRWNEEKKRFEEILADHELGAESVKIDVRILPPTFHTPQVFTYQPRQQLPTLVLTPEPTPQPEPPTVEMLMAEIATLQERQARLERIIEDLVLIEIAS